MRFEPKKKRTHKSWKPKLVDVSIITVNYNGFNDTCQMIESVYEHIHSVAYEIIVVDNASQSNEAVLLRKKYPFVHAIRSSANKGFAGGNNLGYTVAKGKYLFFLNNDTIIKEDKFRKLIDRLETDATVGGVCPMIRYADGDEVIQYAGFTPLTRYTLRNQSIGNGEYLNERYLRAKEVPYMHGAAMLVKREAYEAVGKMPEVYFLYYEELDWSISLRKAGYKLWYDPCCMVYHKESRSTGIDSPLKVFYLTRNRFLFAYRNRTLGERLTCYFYLLACVAPRDYVRYVSQHRYDLASAVLRGVSSYFKLTNGQKVDGHEYKYSYYIS